MAKEVFPGFGPGHTNPQAGPAECGGIEAKDVKTIRYAEPQGPIGINHKGVGLGGDNHHSGTQGTYEHMTGSPGIGGTRNKSGSQR